MKIVSERDVLTLKVGDFVEVKNPDGLIDQYIIACYGALEIQSMTIYYGGVSPDGISAIISQECEVLAHVPADKVELHLKK